MENPPQAQENGLVLNPELEDLCPLQLMLILQIIPLMSIVTKHKGAVLFERKICSCTCRFQKS